MRCRVRRAIALATLVPLLFALILGGTGCAAIMRGRSQKVRLQVSPEDRTLGFENRRVRDGSRIRLDKEWRLQQLWFRGETNGFRHTPTYHLDPWLIADSLLLLFGIIPGAVALGVDFGTGAWRQFRSSQLIWIPHDVDAPPIRDRKFNPDRERQD